MTAEKFREFCTAILEKAIEDTPIRYGYEDDVYNSEDCMIYLYWPDDGPVLPAGISWPKGLLFAEAIFEDGVICIQSNTAVQKSSEASVPIRQCSDYVGSPADPDLFKDLRDAIFQAKEKELGQG